MNVDLYPHQKDVLPKIKSGTILKGGTGSGKSRTSIAWYYFLACEGLMKINGKGTFQKMKRPKDLYIITTAEKRNRGEWNEELLAFYLEQGPNTTQPVSIKVDSWNNIQKYKTITNAVFIFDEQRAIGSGAWAKTFIKIARKNDWIMLSYTPGDKWRDYAPVFIAKGYYKNITHFETEHVIQNPWVNYKSILRYINCDVLLKHKYKTVVEMRYTRKAIVKTEYEVVPYDDDKLREMLKKRWNYETEKPIKTSAELAFMCRKIVNQNNHRIDKLVWLHSKHHKLIVFYNFKYELEMLRDLCQSLKIPYGELNGQHHHPVPTGNSWIYLVQYIAGSEAWNCITTDTTVFFSLNHSYRMTVQAKGRIDRMNTPYEVLYYYFIVTHSHIDKRIRDCHKNKKDFNENKYMPSREKHGL